MCGIRECRTRSNATRALDGGKAKMKRTRPNSRNFLADAAYDLGSLTPAGALISTAGKAYKKHVKKNPAKFDRCVKAVKKRGGARNAYAVCKAATSKGNKGKIQRFLLNTGTRRNPEDTAADRYEYFHGRKADVDTVDKRTIHTHDVLSGIGKLEQLEILAVNGNRKVLLSHFKGALLAQDEKGKQLYIVGGDQSVNLKDFGIARCHELEILGALTSIVYFTTKDHLTPEDGGTANYKHKFGPPNMPYAEYVEYGRMLYEFGKKGTRFPLVGYDVRNKLLSIQGGGYDIPAEGIDG
jgi:hypothetical protein